MSSRRRRRKRAAAADSAVAVAAAAVSEEGVSGAEVLAVEQGGASQGPGVPSRT